MPPGDIYLHMKIYWGVSLVGNREYLSPRRHYNLTFFMILLAKQNIPLGQDLTGSLQTSLEFVRVLIGNERNTA